MRRLLPLLAVVSASFALAGGSADAAPLAPIELPVAHAFTDAGAKTGVPRDLLIAIAAVEGGLEIPALRTVDPDATIPVAGPLHLRRGKLDTLKRGAELMGTTELALRQNADLALEAGARVLAELGAKTGATADDLASWEAALEELGGYADQPHRVDYAHRVFRVLNAGRTALPARDGETVMLPAHPVPASVLSEIARPTLPSGSPIVTFSGAEYPTAEWFPTSCSGKCDTNRGGNSVQFVVIHDTEGGWDASVSTLQNDPGKSVHYIVGQDGRVGQFVPESYTAWHAGNYWYNQRSVGIEHVGYYTKTYPTEEYVASAKLVDYLTKKYSVKKDRAHIIGHDQIPNGNVMAESSAPCSDSPKNCETGSNYGGAGNHRDPGDWEWCTYMPRFGGTCKCNDIWELWNCSSDKTQAFRCVSGKVELETCDGPGGCEVMPLGTADVCHQKPPSPPDAGPTDAGDDAATADTGTSANDDAGPILGDSGTPGTDSGTGTNLGDSTDGSSGGCGCRTSGNTGAASGIAPLLFAMVALLRRRR